MFLGSAKAMKDQVKTYKKQYNSFQQTPALVFTVKW